MELVRRYGSSLSHAALDPLRSIFHFPGIAGLISFVPTTVAVVLGDVICTPEHKVQLADPQHDPEAGYLRQYTNTPDRIMFWSQRIQSLRAGVKKQNP